MMASKRRKTVHPTYQYGDQTAKEHGSQSPKSIDTHGIYGTLIGNKDGSRGPKSYKRLNTHTQQENREGNYPHDISQRKQGTRGTPDPLA